MMVRVNYPVRRIASQINATRLPVDVSHISFERFKKWLAPVELVGEGVRGGQLKELSTASAPVCGTRMKIENGEGLGARYWRCPSRHARKPWDHQAFLDDLPLEAKQYLF